jgi:hypothetical protein
MKHIQSYMNKIEGIIASNKPSSKKKPTGFAPTKEKQTEETKKEDMNMKIVADTVQGIREARKGMLSATK